MITKVLALDLRERNIQVNAIAPGFIKTPLNAGFRADNADYRRRATSASAARACGWRPTS